MECYIKHSMQLHRTFTHIHILTYKYTYIMIQWVHFYIFIYLTFIWVTHIYIVRRTMYINTMYDIQCTIFNVRHTLYDIQCMPYNVRYTMHTIHSCHAIIVNTQTQTVKKVNILSLYSNSTILFWNNIWCVT